MMIEQENNSEAVLEINQFSTINDIIKYNNFLSLINQQYFSNAQQASTENENTSFCIVVPSYNNIKYITQALNSVFRQEYHNWKMLYVDDASNDGTYELVESIKYLSGLDDNKFKLDRHETRKRSPLYAFVHASNSFCEANDVMVHLDGDDMLATSHVLTKLNNIYEQENIWITYGQFIDNKGNIGNYCNKEILLHDWQNLRLIPWSTSHLRTSYTWLFRKIDQKDLKYNEEFFNTSGDLALMFPMLEMAGKERTKFIKDILYIYRWHQNNDEKLYGKEQKEAATYIRNLPKYLPLPSNYNYKLDILSSNKYCLNDYQQPLEEEFFIAGDSIIFRT